MQFLRKKLLAGAPILRVFAPVLELSATGNGNGNAFVRDITSLNKSEESFELG